MTANHHLTIALTNERIADFRRAAAADRAAAAASDRPSATPANAAHLHPSAADYERDNQ